MKNTKKIWLVIIIFFIGFIVAVCDNGNNPQNSVVGNQTPVAADFDIGNLTQTAGNVTPVTISPKAGKSTGAITIFYNGSTTFPTAVGTYVVRFDVAAATGWNAATGLLAGNLVISNPQTPVAGDYTVGNLNQIAGSVTAVTITANSGKSPGAVVNIRYNGNVAIPQTAGTFAVTFDVAAAAGWRAATGLSAGNLVVGNGTPVAGDYTFGNMNQIAGSVTAVTITANSGRSPGAVINIRYNGNVAIPQTAGTYSVTFDIEAASGWNAATGLSAGNLTITNPSVGIIINLDMYEWNLIEQSVQAIADLNLIFNVSGNYLTYRWYLDGVLVGTSSS